MDVFVAPETKLAKQNKVKYAFGDFLSAGLGLDCLLRS